MADVADAFIRGKQAGEASVAHQDALAQNKLRTMILKHQIEGIKIDTELRTRELARQNLELLQGQPEADLPTETFEQPNLPSRSQAGAMTGLPDVVSSLVQQRMGGAGPQTLAAPGAQETALGTNQASRVKPVQIPGVPSLGVEGVSVRPRSLEDLTHASIMAKLLEPYTLNRGDIRVAGGRVVARGMAPAPTRPLVVNGRVLDAETGDTLAEVPRQVDPNAVTPDERAKERALRERGVAAREKDAATRANRPPTAATDQTGVYGTATKRGYDAFVESYKMRNPDKKPDRFGNPIAVPNWPAPPSLEKWYAMTPEERQRALADPKARITDEEMRKRLAAKGEESRTDTSADAAGKTGAGQTVTLAEVEAIAKKRGRSVEEQRQLYIENGYAVVK